MNVFAKFDEIPFMILQDIKETKRYGHTSDVRSVGQTDNVKTVYPITNIVCGGYKNGQIKGLISHMWLILEYTVQRVIPDVCTKFQNPKSSGF